MYKNGIPKIVDLLDMTSDDKHLPRLNWNLWLIRKKITTLTKKSELAKPILKSDLCDFSDAYIAVKGDIIVTNSDDAKRNKIVFKNNAPFINCILKISSVQIDNAEDFDVAI